MSLKRQFEPFGIRCAYATLNDNPFLAGDENSLIFESDGLVVIDHGLIHAAGHYNSLRPLFPGLEIVQYQNALLVPGFIDTHVHYPQLPMIGSCGEQLIDWLTRYTFETEQRFCDIGYARRVADHFLDACLDAGTTTAAVYCTVHPESVDAFFAASLERGLRMLAGKVLMDRNAPAALLDTAQTGYDQSEQLIRRWHGQHRLSYAITPRFAPTSTPAQLEAAGALRSAYPDVLVQTHLSENPQEVAWVKSLFPERRHYLDVYAHYGLTGPRCIFGHALHLCESEWQMLSDSGSSIAHCPTSNAFLGSGLFDLETARSCQPNMRLGLATDVGAGTTLSMLKTMGAAYNVAQLRGNGLSPVKAFHMATYGAAQALHLEERIGRITAGLEADLVILDLQATPVIKQRMAQCSDITDTLFVQMILGDERSIRAVYSAGKSVKPAV